MAVAVTPARLGAASGTLFEKTIDREPDVSDATTLVLGIGNTLLTDEGVGIHVVNALDVEHPALTGVTLIDGGTLSFTLAESVSSHDRLIVVDAARTGSPPGTVSCFEGEAMDRYLSGNRQSVHEVGLSDLLDIARLTESYPRRRALIGVEPLDIGWGERPSEPVSEAIPRAVAQVLALLQRWNDGAPSEPPFSP